MIPHVMGGYGSLLLLQATPSSQSQTLEELIDLTRRSSMALNLSPFLAPGTTLIHPEHCQKQLTKVVLVFSKTHIFSSDP